MYSYGRLSRDAGGSNRSSDLSTRSDDEDEASVPGDEAEVDGFIGYRNCTWKLVAYWVGVVLTGGALGLFTLWWPGMWPALTKKRASMADATSFLVQAQGRYKMAYVQTEWDDVRWFEIQQLRFVYQPEAATYVRLQHYKDLKCVDIPQQAVGIQRDVALHRLRMSGPNAFNIPQEHIVVAWLRGMLSPFHVFILGTCILWYVDDYTVFASVILAVTIISVSLTVWDERRNINRIQKLINQQSVVETLRDGSWLALQSGGLVHGDLITLDDNQVVPADVVIVSGECVVDESQLTGESTPVRKYAVTEKEEEDEASPSIYSQTHDIKHTLFSGTRLLKVIPRQGTDRVTAFVYSTGFNTRKGGLIRRILYPSDVVFRYRRHTMLFILALILVAPVSFTVSFVFWDSYDVGTWENILRSLEVITLLVPVTIPIMQMMAQGIAALNLRQYGIFTIAPSRIIMSGKIRMMCFDKTGTLTENGLRMKAVLPTQHSVGGRWVESAAEGLEKAESSRAGQGRDAGVQFVAAPVLMTALPASHLIKQAMACCHSATNIEGEGLIGHPLDVEMFNASQWRMREGKDGTVFSSPSSSSSSSSASSAAGRSEGLELRVVKAFPFVHSLRRMSVIVKSSLDSSISLFTKGSPETIRDLALPETVPANLDDTLREHARKGNYILAIGAKFNVLDDEEEVHHVHRKQIDKDLVFLGLLIFQNEVREDSAEVISRLKHGDIRNVIITGDGPYTALAVARECGMIDLGSTVALGHTGQDGTTSAQTAAPQYGVQWVNVDTGREMGQDWVDAHESAKYVAFGDGHVVHKRRSTLSLFDRVRWWTGARRQRQRDRHLNFDDLDSALLAADVAGGVDMESPALAASAEERPSEFILTGTAFDYLKTSEPHLLGKLLFDVRIFARFSPEQKAEVVNLINSTGLVTGMCGDGGNDCGALRAAHAGIAVGGGGVEASVVSPFTSSLASIRCTEILIREGRGALANSLAAFKLLVLIYVVILHTVILLLYHHGSDMSDGMYIYQDLLLVFPLSLFILYPNSATKLARQRPSASLLNSTVIASMLGQTGIVIAFIVGARQLLYAQDWYVPFDPVANGASARSDYWKSYETTTLWVFCNFQYIAAAIAFAIGRPFRKEIWHNYLLSLNVLGSLAAASWVLLLPPEWLRDVLYLEDLKTDFKISLYFMALGCMVTQVLYEAFITMGPFAWVMRRISRGLNLRKKHRLRN